MIRFEDNASFMTYCSTVYSESDAIAAAAAAMGWGRYDGITVAKNNGKWMAYCTRVNGQTYAAGQNTCTSF